MRVIKAIENASLDVLILRGFKTSAAGSISILYALKSSSFFLMGEVAQAMFRRHLHQWNFRNSTSLYGDHQCNTQAW